MDCDDKAVDVKTIEKVYGSTDWIWRFIETYFQVNNTRKINMGKWNVRILLSKNILQNIKLDILFPQLGFFRGDIFLTKIMLHDFL